MELVLYIRYQSISDVRFLTKPAVLGKLIRIKAKLALAANIMTYLAQACFLCLRFYYSALTVWQGS